MKTNNGNNKMKRLMIGPGSIIEVMTPESYKEWMKKTTKPWKYNKKGLVKIK